MMTVNTGPGEPHSQPSESCPTPAHWSGLRACAPAWPRPGRGLRRGAGRARPRPPSWVLAVVTWYCLLPETQGRCEGRVRRRGGLRPAPRRERGLWGGGPVRLAFPAGVGRAQCACASGRARSARARCGRESESESEFPGPGRRRRSAAKVVPAASTLRGAPGRPVHPQCSAFERCCAK